MDRQAYASVASFAHTVTVVAPEMVQAVLTDKWRAAILPLQWLAIFTGAVAATWILTAPLVKLPPALKLFREIQCSVWDYLRILTPALVGSTAMICGVLVLKKSILPGAWLLQPPSEPQADASG
jgi:hypothetical protein